MDRPLEDQILFTTVQADTTWLGQWTFDAGANCTPEGWVSLDVTAQTGCYWHIADATELDGGNFGGLIVLSGDQSLWCGASPDPGDEVLCGYATLPGYGNGWDQGWCMHCIDVPDTEEVYIEYLIAWDSEPGYDYTYVEYATKSSCDSLTHPDFIHNTDWNILNTYDGVGNGSASDTIPSGHEGKIKIRFHFTSDGAWSDQDGLWNTDGAVILDNVTIRDETGYIYDYEDFEYKMGEGGENPGDTQTADGDWECCLVSGYGDYAGLYPGLTLLQEDPCKTRLTCMWSFINGTTVNYACGGHPEQDAVPFMNERGQAIANMVVSPPVDWVGSGTSAMLEFDVYRDLPIPNVVFYNWSIRSIDASGCPGGWRDRGFGYYGGNKDWIRAMMPCGDLIKANAEKIQVMLMVFDMCPYWCIIYGDGDCHSHSPLFDNVEIYRISTTGPQWSVRDIDLFQDTFPENGTSVGTGRIDMALDRLPSRNPGILPGDSAKVLVSDPTTDIGSDTYTGFGSSVYFYMRRDPGPGIKPIATTKVEEDSFRWPLVDSVMAGGEKWYMFRMDTCFTQVPRGGPVPNAFCIDINDHYFTNGDTILFFFGAHNALNEWTWWSQFTGTVNNIEETARKCTGCMDGKEYNAMEMQILPGEGVANGGDVLYVDNFSGRGAQPYFESAFNMAGILRKVDRFDKRGPSSLVGNALAHHATVAQLHDSYRKIIWNSGDLSVGTVGDGAAEKADDYSLLFAFLDLHPHPNGGGIYFSGDDLAQELDGMTTAGSQQFKYVYMPHTLITGNHNDLHRISPLGIGEGAGSGVPPSVGIFDHGPPIGVDSLYAFGGCPIINDFDVIAPIGSATLEMCYDPVNEADDTNPAVVAFDTLNALGNRVGIVLSGFSYHYIRDDRPAGEPDRLDHIAHILRYLGNILDEWVSVQPSISFKNSLTQNYPNPFNPSTTIKYSVKNNTHVSLKIYNVAGQLVHTLVDSDKNAGAYTETWDGRGNSGNPVSSGVYFYKLVTKDFSMTKKMVLLK
jgi:hypothetical protein